MKTIEFDYELPASSIAQTPLTERDRSKLLVLNRQTGAVIHRYFPDLLDYLQAGDVLVGNNSRVMPARIYGKKETGGKVELLLLQQLDAYRWQALVGGKRVNAGITLQFQHSHIPLTATITAVLAGGLRELTFSHAIAEFWDEIGHTPLPPYIHTTLNDNERYQTIYAQPTGSSAAPTAGLHFTPELLFALREKGVQFETVTLHIGLDTFKPVEVSQISDHPIHTEWVRLNFETAKRINSAKIAGKRIIAVGTTTVRTLETAAWRSAGIHGSLQQVSSYPKPDFCPWQPVVPTEGFTDLYIYPGYEFRVVDGLITNFHMPQSTLMMLVSAFAGIQPIRHAYKIALQQNYRFLSFGDAMFIE